MNRDDIRTNNKDNDSDDQNPDSIVDDVEDGIPSENVDPTSAPNDEAPDGR